MINQPLTRRTKEETNQEFYGNFWNENMINYLSKSAGARWFKYLLSIILKEIDPKCVHTVADVGCGVGTKTVALAEYFTDASVLGTDFAISAINAAKKVHKLKNLDFSVEDITEAEYRKQYDLITAFDVLEHTKDWKKLVKKIIKVNDRYIIFSFPVGRMRQYETNIGHYRNFKKNEMEKFMSLISNSGIGRKSLAFRR